LETDAPSIGLDGVAPEATEPHHVRDVAQALAELKGESVEGIARSTTRNAEQLFQLG
jgi:TatD DNase family protein